MLNFILASTVVMFVFALVGASVTKDEDKRSEKIRASVAVIFFLGFGIWGVILVALNWGSY